MKTVCLLFLISFSEVIVTAVTEPVRSQTADNSPQTQEASSTYDISVPPPTCSGLRYGEHERHILDFWRAPSDTPTPLVFVIHGGAWRNGSKERLSRFVDATALLEEGISIVAINYRLIRNGKGIEPPVKAPLQDAAQAL